jgi:hypothetical protein
MLAQRIRVNVQLTDWRPLLVSVFELHVNLAYVAPTIAHARRNQDPQVGRIKQHLASWLQ